MKRVTLKGVMGLNEETFVATVAAAVESELGAKIGNKKDKKISFKICY
jgi:hypothetical protein